MCARSWSMSIATTDLPIDFLFFDPGGRPRRFAFLAIATSLIREAALISRLFRLCHAANLAWRRTSHNPEAVENPRLGTARSIPPWTCTYARPEGRSHFRRYGQAATFLLSQTRGGDD